MYYPKVLERVDSPEQIFHRSFSLGAPVRGTDNVQGQISEHIFAPNGDYCLCYPSNLFHNARRFENWGVFNNYSMSARWI